MRFLSTVIVIFFLGISCACNRCLEPCVNGVCKKKTCECDSWWEGDGCERSVLKRFEGVYEGNTTCNNVQDVVEFSLVVNPAAPNQLRINGNELYLEFTTTVEFDIPAQSWQGLTVTGEGQMLVDRISFHYTSVDTAIDINCLVEADLRDN